MRRVLVVLLVLAVSLVSVLPAAAQPPAVDPAAKACTHLLAMHPELADTAGYSEYGVHHAQMAAAGKLGGQMNPGMHTGLAGLCDHS